MSRSVSPIDPAHAQASSAHPADRADPRADNKSAPARRSAGEPQIDRRLNILLAAEKLFALNGYHAVSIREIAIEAEVPFALVHYHYGSKHELYHAIFASWSSVIDERLARLHQALAKPAAPDLLDMVIDAFVAPVVELRHRADGRYYATMAARDLAAQAPEADEAQRTYFDPMARAFVQALAQVFPQQPRGRIAWCYQFMLGALTHFLTDQRVERLSDGDNTPADPRALQLLLQFIAAGFRAVLGEPAGVARSTSTSTTDTLRRTT